MTYYFRGFDVNDEAALEAVKQIPDAIEYIRNKEMFYKVAKAMNIEVA